MDIQIYILAPNMENIEKIILAMLIVIFTIYILLKIVFKLDNKIDSYTILGLYLLVLILGLLRIRSRTLLRNWFDKNWIHLVLYLI